MSEAIRVGEWMIQRIGSHVQIWPADCVPEVWCREFPGWTEAVEWIERHSLADSTIRHLYPQ